jgi:hypothetical protein
MGCGELFARRISKTVARSADLAKARLPPGKSLEAFDFDAAPIASNAQAKALAADDARIENGDAAATAHMHPRVSLANASRPDRPRHERSVVRNQRCRVKHVS